MDILGNLRGLISDGTNGSLSSKRVITIICTILMMVGFIGNMFFGYHIDSNIYNAIMYVVVVGVGFTGIEKFAPKLS